MKLKFVPEITNFQKIELEKFMENSHNTREIKRANAIIMSSKGLSINEISKIYDVDRDTVSRWISWWIEYGIEGLKDDLHTGRKSKLNGLQRIEVIQIVKEEPRKLKLAVSKVKERFNKEVSIKTIKRILYKKNLDGNELDDL